MHVKNIRNMKFNGQIFKIYKKKEIYNKFEEFPSILVWRETLSIEHGAPYTFATLMRFQIIKLNKNSKVFLYYLFMNNNKIN